MHAIMIAALACGDNVRPEGNLGASTDRSTALMDAARTSASKEARNADVSDAAWAGHAGHLTDDRDRGDASVVSNVESCALDATYTYDWQLGMPGRGDMYRSRVGPAAKYSRERLYQKHRTTCAIRLPACGSASIDAADLVRAFSAPEIRGALRTPGRTEFGDITGPAMDSPLFVVSRAGGGQVVIGDPCREHAYCSPLPESARALKELLLALDEQQTARRPCRHFRN